LLRREWSCVDENNVRAGVLSQIGRAACLAIVLVVATRAMPQAAPTPLYAVSLVTPVSGAQFAEKSGEALAVNASGDIAGYFGSAAFVRRDGKFATYPVPDAPSNFSPEYRCDHGTFGSYAVALNASGTAVGDRDVEVPCNLSGFWTRTEGVIFSNRRMLGNHGAHATAINDNGTLVGVMITAGTNECAPSGFVADRRGGGKLVPGLAPDLVDNSSTPMAINNEGYVVGTALFDRPGSPRVAAGALEIPGRPTIQQYASAPGKATLHAFLFSSIAGHARMRDLGALSGYPDTIAMAINEARVVVGYSGTQGLTTDSNLENGPTMRQSLAQEGCVLGIRGPSHAWIWQNGRMTDIGGARKVDSAALGINDSGVIVGYSGKSAVRWIDKNVQDLNAMIAADSGWRLEAATAINSAGTIVGFGSYRGHDHVPFQLELNH
jgi:uncharacterized membrane protein